MNAEEMFDGEVIRAKYIVEHYIESGITTWIYIPEEKKEIKMSETNLEHYKKDLKGILTFNYNNPRGVIKKIREIFGCQIKLKSGEHPTDAILEWMVQPYREPILDDVEREYLSEVIKPFLSKIKYIAKFKSACSEDKQYIHIGFYEGDGLTFPYFKENSMYKGMELNKAYTLKELRLC